MKLRQVFLGFVRAKATWFCVVVGLLCAGAGWWLLPPPVRSSMALGDHSRVLFSTDFRFLAIFSPTLPRGLMPDLISIWNVQTSQRLCLFESGRWQYSFSRDGKSFIQFNSDLIQVRDVFTGHIIKSKKNEASYVTKDALGRPVTWTGQLENANAPAKLESVQDLLLGANVDATSAELSLDGKSLAIIGEHALTIYDFPLRTPWARIVGYALVAAACEWILGWLIGRRRRRSSAKGRVAIAQPQADHDDQPGRLAPITYP